MTYAHDNPYGSARFATEGEIRRAFRKRGTLPVAFHGGRLLSHSSDAGMLLISGAGAGKFTSVLAHIMGIIAAARGPVRLVVSDPKLEIFETIGPGLVHHGVRAYAVAPFGQTRLSTHRLDLFSHLSPNTRTLVADCEKVAETWIPKRPTPGETYWEDKARIWLGAIVRGLVHADGALSLARLRETVAMIISAPEAWAEIAPIYAALGEPDLTGTFGEMVRNADTSERVYQSVVGELTNALAPANDPNILNSFVGKDEADFSFDVLTEDSDLSYAVFLGMPAEYSSQLSAVLRQSISTLRATKYRKQNSPRVHLIIDEAALTLGRFPELVDVYSYDRGPGITPLTVWQSYGQIRRNLGETAIREIVGSSDLELYLGGGITDLETATELSRKLGDQTLYLEDKLTQARAQRAKSDAIRGALTGQADPMQVGMQLHALNTEIGHQTKMARRLVQPNEIMGLPRGNALVVPSGYGIPPFLAQARPYYSMTRYAGQYFPNPYFDRDPDSLRVKTWLGTRKRRVIREAVPSAFADFPQYQHGEWAFIEGYRPKTPKT